MSFRQVLIGFLIFSTLAVPLIQLSIGFYYVYSTDLCPIQPDIMLLMAIGGLFYILFFGAGFGLAYMLIPPGYKKSKEKATVQTAAETDRTASKMLIGFITTIFAACAIIFFVLIQMRVYTNFPQFQTTNSTSTTNYCTFTIFSSAFGLMIATYVAIGMFIVTVLILLLGIGLPK